MVPSQLQGHDDAVAEVDLQDAKKETGSKIDVVEEMEDEIVVIKVV